MRLAVTLFLALVLTLGSLAVQRFGPEVSIYGHEGTIDENVRERLVGGWPAPFLVDSMHTSVPRQLGVEDELRFGPFLATLAFWYLLVSWVLVGIRRLRTRSER